MNLKLTPILFLTILFFSCQEEKEEYVCDPCDLPCDTITFFAPGICPYCNMKLVKKSEVLKEANLKVNEIDTSTGSSVFLIEGGESRPNKTIKIFYHQPINFSKDSKILIIIPGAGRNGDSYRDAWVEASEKYNVLILSPMYSEENYSFEDYHMGGLIQESNIREAIDFIENSNVAQLDETAFTFDISTNQKEWIFNDFDRIFDLVVKATQSNQTQYDIFGHSAGGQILHRFALFHPASKANQIVASNSGFYTLPDVETELPFGMKNTNLSKEHLKGAFSKKLILLIGELDNEQEQGGTLLHSTTVDKQGTHRLERGQYFYEESKKIAKEIGANYNWEIKVAPAVGHDHRAIGLTAAKLLYD